MAIFNSYVSHYQRVFLSQLDYPEGKPPFSYGFPMVFTIYQTGRVPDFFFLREVLGIGSEEVVTLITQQKERGVVKRQPEKTNETRSLGEDVIYDIYVFSALRYIATTSDDWTLHHYVYDLYLDIYIHSMNIYSVYIYIYEREKDRETNRYLLLQSQMLGLQSHRWGCGILPLVKKSRLRIIIL